MNKIRILLGFVMLLALSACAGDTVASNPPELLVPISARVDTAVVTRGPVASVSRHVGITRTRSESLSFGSVANRFGSFYVHIGDYVTEGQLLARLDTESIENDIAEQVANIARMRQENALYVQGRILEIDRLAYEYATMTRTAAENLDENAMATAHTRRFDIMRAELSLELAQERQALSLSHAEERLTELRAALTMTELRTPYNGVVTYLPNIETRQWVRSFAPVVYIATDNHVFVEYMGSALQHPGRAVRIIGHINGEIYNLAHRPLTTAEQLYYQSRASTMPIRFEAYDSPLPPLGAYVSIDVYTQWVPDALRIPSNALFHVPGQGFHAYRMENGQLNLAVLEVGARTETFAEIISGLYEGDEVFVRP